MSVRAQHRSIVLAALLTAVVAEAGCWLGNSDYCYEPDRTAMPGQVFNGQDPFELLAPFAGQRRGTVSWLTGDVAGFLLAILDAPPTPINVHLGCPDSDPTRVWTERPATIASDDGAVNHAGEIAVGFILPYEGSPSLVGPQPLDPLSGTLRPPLSDVIDVSLYEASTVELSLNCTATAGPTSGTLRFLGTTGGRNIEIELGTVAF